MYKAGPQDRHGPHIEPIVTVSRAQGRDKAGEEGTEWHR
jgi:hypothetical protein